jgi:hypothetical protein
MLTAEGTRPNARAAAEQLDAVAVEIHFSHLSTKLKATDFFCQTY